MFKRTIAIMFSALLLSAAHGPSAARAQANGDARPAEKARAAVEKLGVGERARVEVTLLDRTKLKGYVSESKDDTFTVSDAKTGAPRVVAYADVAEVKKRGGGMSSTTKAIIFGGIAAGVAVTLYAVRGAFCDGMC